MEKLDNFPRKFEEFRQKELGNSGGFLGSSYNYARSSGNPAARSGSTVVILENFADSCGISKISKKKNL